MRKDSCNPHPARDAIEVLNEELDRHEKIEESSMILLNILDEFDVIRNGVSPLDVETREKVRLARLALVTAFRS